MATTCKLMAKVSLGSDTTTITFSTIPATYTDLFLTLSGRTSRASVLGQVVVKFNSVSSTVRNLIGDGSGASSSTNVGDLYVSGSNATASTFGSIEIYIPNYTGTTQKSWSGFGVGETNASSSYISVTAGLVNHTSAITDIELSTTDGHSYKSGSTAYLYGITKA
jgi:hypothetical protein